MKKFIFLVALLLLVQYGFSLTKGEQRAADSLKRIFAKSTEKEKVSILANLSLCYSYEDSVLSTAYSRQAIALAEKLGNYHCEIIAHFYLSMFYSNHFNRPKELNQLLIVLDIAKKHHDNEEIAKTFGEIGRCYMLMNNFNEALNYQQKALELFTQLDNKTGIAKSIHRMGTIYLQKEQYRVALLYFEKALQLHQKNKNSGDIAKAYYHIGFCYYEISDYDKAIASFFQCLPLYIKIPEWANVWNTYDMLASTYQKMKNYPKALDFYFKGLEVKKRYSVYLAFAYSYNNLGAVYNETGKYDLALQYSMKSLKIKEKYGEKKDIANSLEYIGRIYKNKGFYEKATDYSNRALQLYHEIQYKEGMIAAIENLGDVAIKAKKYSEALKKYTEALLLANTLKIPDKIRDMHFKLSEIYSSTGNNKEALAHYRLADQMNDSIFSRESQDKIAELQIRYNVEDKDKANLLLAQQLQIQKNRKILFLISGLASFVILLLLIVVYRIKSRALKAKYIAEREIHRLEKERIRLTLDAQNRKLTTAELHLMEKNKTLTDIKAALDPAIVNDRTAYHKLLSYINSSNHFDEEWDNFTLHFEEVHPGFFTRLNEFSSHHLTKEDLLYCAYVRMHLNSKDIARIRHILPRSVKQHLRRLKTKLHLSYEEKLADFLNAL